MWKWWRRCVLEGMWGDCYDGGGIWLLERNNFVVCPVPVCDKDSGGVIWVSLLHNLSPFDDFRNEVDVGDRHVSVAKPLCVEVRFCLSCVVNDIG